MIHFTVGAEFSIYINGKFISTFHNHVTDYGLNTLETKSINDLTTTCHVGSGNSVPTNSDTSLDTEVANTTNTSLIESIEDGSVGYIGVQKKFSFSAGEATGTLAELGLSDGTSLFNRQLFTDFDGNTTTVTISASDTLDILCLIKLTTSVQDVPVSKTAFNAGSNTFNQNFCTRGQFFDPGVASYGWLNRYGINHLGVSGNSWRIAHTLIDYSSSSSEITSGTAADSVSTDSYVANSFEFTFNLSWNIGTFTDNQVDVLYACYRYGASTIYFELGISPGYNQYSETVWQDSHAYTAGDKFISALGDSYIYEVTTGGTSHTSAPTWPTTVGGTVTDGGGVVYECVAPLLRVEDTESLDISITVSWGRET